MSQENLSCKYLLVKSNIQISSFSSSTKQSKKVHQTSNFLCCLLSSISYIQENGLPSILKMHPVTSLAVEKKSPISWVYMSLSISSSVTFLWTFKWIASNFFISIMIGEWGNTKHAPHDGISSDVNLGCEIFVGIICSNRGHLAISGNTSDWRSESLSLNID
jgi:hypothetical protein